MNLDFLEFLTDFDWINSNKSCFWIVDYLCGIFYILWLTVTKVVFEFWAMRLRYNAFNRLTVTKVVFEFYINKLFLTIFPRLTVTKVVFEFMILLLGNMTMKINSNKSCFWIFDELYNKAFDIEINSNKSCFWINCIHTISSLAID